MHEPNSPPSGAPSARACPVVDLNERRLRALEESVAVTRARLDRLERKRLLAEVKAGRLRRKLARHIRELTEERQRVARLQEAAQARAPAPDSPTASSGLKRALRWAPSSCRQS